MIHTKSTPEHPLPEPEIPKKVKVPDYAHLLPEPIRRFTQPAAIQDAEHLSFLQGGGHGGSHPHLVHAFLSAVKGDRPALPDAATSANWTMVGTVRPRIGAEGGRKDRHSDVLTRSAGSLGRWFQPRVLRPDIRADCAAVPIRHSQ